MILTTYGYWIAFFDANHRFHPKSRADLLLFDKEKIIIDAYTVFRVISELKQRGKNSQANWFVDYYLNTANVRIYLLGKEEFEAISMLALEDRENIEKTKIQFISKKLNFDNTLNYDE